VQTIIIGFVAAMTIVLGSAAKSEETARQVKTIRLEPAATQQAAFESATTWLSDVSRHGPISLRRIKVVPESGRFVPQIWYVDAN
jgi:hypothetical protein